ncbi:hypothetical protein GCM10007358_09840 [Phocicoccus schoeneichii]|uniref:LicD family protein n=1 Tax=Phocicoccus schoeneichii TaxID=1812261 RepID=UPI00166C085F|nr:LicD family protein [Jeotgalicoccus schoeneichii]GGH51946.1 hypothetical protein GCM10007358_09840 [Jeotgalicoccus schoeneichii]
MENFIKDVFYRLGVYRYAKKLLLKPYLLMQSTAFKRNAKPALEKMTTTLTENNYTYWLEFGTLLGAIRENKILSHDADIDLAMPREVYDDYIENKIINAGFKKIKEARLLDNTLIEVTFKYKTAQVDIFLAYKKNDKIIFYDYMTTKDLSPNECIKKYGGLIVYENVVNNFELDKHLMYEKKLPIPANYHEHLIELYGLDYIYPNKNWSGADREIRKKVDFYAKIYYES